MRLADLKNTFIYTNLATTLAIINILIIHIERKVVEQD